MQPIETLIPQAAADTIARMIEEDPSFRDQVIADPASALAGLGIQPTLAMDVVSGMFGIEYFGEGEDDDVGGYGCVPPFPICACTKPEFNNSTSKVQACISSGPSTKVVKR